MKYTFLTIIQTVLVASLAAAPIKNIDEYRKLRQEALDKPRAVIYNNDGCDSYLYPKSKLPFTIEKFLKLRTSPLVGTDITTISYCTLSSSFGQFTHNTKAGEFLLNTHKRKGRVNVTPEFAKLKTDPLKEVIKYAHANNMEVFWSNRVNDTHDSGHRPYKPYERWSKFKQAHPEYLMGKCGERFPNGRWSAVDFTHREVRELAVKYLTEVCENYDVDGVELDFFRHLYLFKSVVKGGKASPKELKMLTYTLREIRSMTEHIGMRRGRPILVAIRIPDSVEYCRELGIDLQKWLKDGLIDIIIGSGYFRLNDWKYFVKLGHKYNVKVYAGLSEPRVRNQHPLLQRANKLSYRARAAEALQAEVDGIYLFNQFSVSNPKMGYIREIGKSKKLSKTNKLHFITYRNGSPSRDLKNGIQYQKMKILAPGKALCLGFTPSRYLIYVGDESAAKSSNLILYGRSLSSKTISVCLNGTKLKFIRAHKGLLYYDVPVKVLKPGKNIFSISSSVGTGASVSRTILKGDKRLVWKTQGLWRRLFSGTPRIEKSVNGSYLLGDLGSGSNIYNLIYPWDASPAGRSLISFKVKLKSTTSPDAVCVRVSNGKYAEYLRLAPNKISLKYAGKSLKIDTIDKFHSYKIELNKSRIMVYVDGKLCLQGKLKTSYKKDAAIFANASFRTSYMASNSMIIGSLSGPGKGVAYWKDIKLTSFNQTLLDVALVIINDPKESNVLPFIEEKSLIQKYPQLNSKPWTTVIQYQASNGKLPAKPWKNRSYTSENAKINDNILLLNHNGTAKQEYCYYEYRFPKMNKYPRFTEVLFGLKLDEKTSKAQFTLIVSLPGENKKVKIWGFKFANRGIFALRGRKEVLTAFPIKNQFHNYRVICDMQNGIAELYIDKSSTPIVSTFGRETAKYSYGVKFGDASGAVKGKIALKNIIIKKIGL